MIAKTGGLGELTRQITGTPWADNANMETFVDIDPKQEGLELTNDHYLLMPQQIVGFTLGTRE